MEALPQIELARLLIHHHRLSVRPAMPNPEFDARLPGAVFACISALPEVNKMKSFSKRKVG
jgi:hypothetical protein